MVVVAVVWVVCDEATVLAVEVETKVVVEFVVPVVDDVVRVVELPKTVDVEVGTLTTVDVEDPFR